MSQRVLVVQQDHVSPPGPVGDAFTSRGWDVEEFLVVPADRFHTPSVDVEFPDPTAYDALVPMGAPWSVYDHDVIGPWVHGELSFLRDADDAGVPVLGICFGGQALAAALGGRVERAAEPEIGWYSIESVDESFIEAGPWFEWHSDRWHSPPDAVELAWSPIGPQAFVLRRNLAVQFHPELTPAMLQGWLDNGGAGILAGRGQDPDEVMAQTRALEQDARARADRLVARFLDDVATAG